ncbi:MAG: hypothetical protein ACLS43_13350 [Evtepia gabavorous]
MNIALITSLRPGPEFARQVSRDPTFRRSGPSPGGGPAAPAASLCLPGAPGPLDLTDPSPWMPSGTWAREKPTVTRLRRRRGKWAGSTRSPGGQLGMIDLNCRAAGVTSCLPYSPGAAGCWSCAPPPPSSPCPAWGSTRPPRPFSRAIRNPPLRAPPRGIHVTAVCPYWVKDTEFIPLAQDGKPGQFRHFPLASRSRSVVSLSLAASALNLWVATPGIVCTLHRLGAKVIPHALLVPLMDGLRRV